MEEEQKIEWQAPEFEEKSRSKNWYWIAGIAGLTIIIMSIIFKNYLGAFVFLFYGLIYFFNIKRKPRIFNFIISSAGINIGQKLYKFGELKSFWIFDQPERKELSVESKHFFTPYIKIPLADQDSSEIRNFLINFLPETEQEETIMEILERKLKL